MSFTVFSKVASSLQRFIRMVSAPNISGTSVMMVVPPLEARMSEKAPTVGFAVMPDMPSDAPHFSPTTSSEASMSSLLSFEAAS